MQIHFTGHNVEITPALKNYASEKVTRLEKRHANLTTINLILKLDNHEHVAEATVHVSGKEIHAESKAIDMYTAIDELVDKLIAQVTKHKEKISDHHR